MKHRHKHQGFSLIEILIVVALLGMMGVTLAVALSSSIDVREQVTEVSEEYHLIRQAMSRMVSELSMAYVSKQKPTSFAVIETGFKGLKDRVTFNAFGGYPQGSKERISDQREISYFVGRTEKYEKALIRRIKTKLDNEFDRGGREEMVCPNVSNIRFEYWREDRSDWTGRWELGDSASSEKTLPGRVRIHLTVETEPETEKEFMTETQIMLTKPFKIE